MSEPLFWKTKTLAQMSEQEWESLCDGCAKCCLVKLEDEDTSEIHYTGLHCRLLDARTCQCSDYPNRRKIVPDCVKLTPESVGDLDWLPRTCAYRLVNEGRDLYDWHHLICGDRWEVHRRGVSAMDKTINEDDVDPEDAEDHIVNADTLKRR
ncbi:YcgN family cysteine cluster protein [bacterium]|nr:YcgN family cysteine cluster protein [bacterium]